MKQYFIILWEAFLMERVYNFSAGPSMLPVEVLERAQKEMLNYGGSGQSVMEMSHRSKEYQAIIDEAEALLREIMQIPDNYKVLFLQGGQQEQGCRLCDYRSMGKKGVSGRQALSGGTRYRIQRRQNLLLSSQGR